MKRANFMTGRLSGCLVGLAVLAMPHAQEMAWAQTIEPPKAQKPQKSQAKSGDSAAAGKPADRAAAEQAYAAGVRAYEAGKLPEAVTALSNALISGGLPNPQMARALYLRGTAYRKQSQPALAYADLTSALWLKNGLADPEKSKAVAEREAAHREAGLGNQAPPVPGSEPKAVASAAQPASPTAPKPGVDVASAPSGSSVLDALNPLNLFSSGSSKPAQQQIPAAVSPPPAAAAAPAPAPAASIAPQAAPAAAQPTVSSWSTTSAPAVSPAPVASAGYAEPAQQQAASSGSDPLSTASEAVTGFFGSVFGSSSGATATSQPSAPVTTASTAPVAAPVAPAPAAAAVPWTNPDALAAQQAPAQPQAQVSQAPSAQAPAAQAPKKPANTQMAALAPAPQAQSAVKAVKTSANGKYRLQVATVHTREEADKIAANVAGNPVIGGAAPEVDSVVYGNMGTFFRVRVGPYATSAQPAELCKQLRPQGYDCLVVTQ